jgi:hypothetical protein
MNRLTIVVAALLLMATAGCSSDDIPTAPYSSAKTDHPDETTLSRYADGSLGSHEHQLIADHLCRCRQCCECVQRIREGDVSELQKDWR